jgi:hypothetical protein
MKHDTQNARILASLRANAGRWVPLPALFRRSGSLAIHSHIADLRKRGHSIVNHVHWRSGRIHSRYMLLAAQEAREARR